MSFPEINWFGHPKGWEVMGEVKEVLKDPDKHIWAHKEEEKNKALVEEALCWHGFNVVK